MKTTADKVQLDKAGRGSCRPLVLEIRTENLTGCSGYPYEAVKHTCLTAECPMLNEPGIGRHCALAGSVTTPDEMVTA